MNWIRIASYGLALCVVSGCNAPSPAPAAGAASTAPAASGSPAKSVSFAADVKPIFSKYCADCHLNGSAKGGFALDSTDTALQEGRNGARIVAGDSANSNLLHRVKGDPGVKKMPPKGESMSADEIAVIAAWIDQGANAG